MSRFAKKFRVLSSLCILLNLITILFPVTKRIQENYADLTWKQTDYIQSAFAAYIPVFREHAEELRSVPPGWILFFMVLPLVMSLIAGIWGLTGSYRQKVSSILSFGVLAIYIGMMANISYIWPEAAAGQEYCRGSACMLTLIFSGCSAAWAAAALAFMPKNVKIAEAYIPQAEEIRQEQTEKKYNIRTEEKQEVQTEQTQGVLVGRIGIYAGAEINVADGEWIRLGRHPDNHLVFADQLNVSRNHCQIKWDAGRRKYVFRDYSSNGSFANGSTDCLPQNLDVDLDPGTVVAIGDENNTFYLR